MTDLVDGEKDLSEDRKKWANKDEENWRTISNIHYYLREGYYGMAILLCDGILRVKPNPPITVLKGVALTLLGKIPEATRVLESLNNEEECSLGILYALKWAHSCAFNPDHKSIVEIETGITKRSRDDATPSSAFGSAAEVLYFAKEYQKSKQLLEIAQKRSKEKHAEYYCLLGWIDLGLGKNQKSTQELFEKSAGQGYPDGYIGRCKILEGHHSAGEMKTVAKELTISSYQFIPGHIEKCKASIMMKEWNNSLDAIQNSNVPDGQNPYLEVLRAIYSICYAGQKGGLSATLSLLQKSLEENEGINHLIFAKIAALITSMSGKDRTILTFAKTLLTKAIQLARKPEYLALGLRIAMGLGDCKEVSSLAKELVAVDCDDSYAALGTVISMLMGGRIKDARAQYDVLLAAHPWLQNSPLYSLIGGVMVKRGGTIESFTPFVEQFVEHLRKALQAFPFGLDYLSIFQSDLLFLSVEQLLDFAPLVPMKAPDECLKLADRILSMVLDVAPALAHCAYQMARVKYLVSNFHVADEMVKLALDKNETLTDAYILKAQILLDRGEKINEAEAALTTGLNFNFSLRETSLYHLIRSKTLKRKGENEEAVKTLQTALKINKKEISENFLLPKESADTHKISVQLELIDTLQLMKRTIEAEQAMADAMSEWNGKPEQDQLIISQAQLYVSKGQSEKALDVLRKIEPGKSNFHLSRIKMAQIYLEERKDKRMFATCYKELLQVAPSPSSYATLGDAFMSIQEPEEAISYYEQALKMQSKDVLLAEKIGEAYVMAHLYAKAVNFYESSMNIYKDKNMRMKLANLLLQLQNFDKCERILRQPLEQDPNPIDNETLQSHVQLYLLLGQVYEQKEQFTEAFDAVERAKNLQVRLQTKADPGSTAAMKREVAKTWNLLADLHLRCNDIAKASEAYREAANLHEQDIKSHLALARIYMQQSKLHLCSQMCKAVITIDKDNDEATLMMADLLYLKNDGNQASIHFMQLLTRNPNQYHALARVVELSWRNGDLEHAEKYLARALEANPRATIDAGYNYCKGLNEWYMGDINGALQAFNRARRDYEWGEKAIYNMIEICLNPDNEIIGGEVLQSENGADEADRAMGTKTADSFLQELRFKQNLDSRFNLMENFILLHSGNKNNVNTALNAFLQMIGDGEAVANVGAVFGAARAYISSKQLPKAKQLLKRVIDHTWTLDDAYYLEKCWLLLADIYIGQNKQEQSIRMLDLVQQHNASSLKCFEYYGHVREKEQKYVDAYKFYEKAWQLSKQKSPAIGFKLASNYLKCKKLFHCIETCHKVLEINPSYPKIKKEIMDKARAMIRT